MATAIATEIETLHNYVGGQWIEAEATETQEVRNPATDEVLARVPLSGASDVAAAVRAAAAAY
ncbi:MAG: aldehyde dehydrogenase family protein, partial [Chloroflexia bacterium]|nr:aldehyde dehydrogenase family protein [Chloroflexia bacterium]